MSDSHAAVSAAPAPVPVTEEAFLADRQQFWGSFTGLLTGAVIGIVILLILMTIFLV